MPGQPLIERVIVHRDGFQDPVTLMEASNEVRSHEGVAHVAVGMADPLSLVIITGGTAMTSTATRTWVRMTS